MNACCEKRTIQTAPVSEIFLRCGKSNRSGLPRVESPSRSLRTGVSLFLGESNLKSPFGCPAESVSNENKIPPFDGKRGPTTLSARCGPALSFHPGWMDWKSERNPEFLQ